MWSEGTKTTVTIFLKGTVTWNDNEYYGVGEVKLPRRIFKWPHSDRIFSLKEEWTAEQLGDDLLIFPLFANQGEEGYEQFLIPEEFVGGCLVTHKTGSIRGVPMEAMPSALVSSLVH